MPHSTNKILFGVFHSLDSEEMEEINSFPGLFFSPVSAVEFNIHLLMSISSLFPLLQFSRIRSLSFAVKA